MTIKKKIQAAAIFFTMICTAFAVCSGICLWPDTGPQTVRASDISYTTKSYHVKMVAHEDHTVDVEENVVVHFEDDAHGIYRNIPMAKDFGYRITDLAVAGEHYSDYMDNGNLMVKIGDPDHTIRGDHSYQISYKLNYVEDKDPNADNFYLNLWFTGWETSVDKLETTLVLPKSIDWKKVHVYGGPQGAKEDSTEWKHYFKQKVDKKKNILSFTGKDVPANFGLTAQDRELPQGYWKGAPKYLDAESTYTVDAHDTKVRISKEHVISVTETVDFTFSKDDPYTSFTFHVPVDKEEYITQNIQAGDGFEMEVDHESGYDKVTLSEPEKTWSGKKTLSYSYELAYYQEREESDVDLLDAVLCSSIYENSQHNVTASVQMPEPVNWSPAYHDFSSYDSDMPEASSYDFFTFDYPGTDSSTTYTAKAAWVPETYSLNLKHPHLPEGYWNSPLDYDKEHMGEYLRWVIVYGAAALIMALLWLLFGRDPQLVKPIAFEPPRGLAPAVIGYIADGACTPREMMTTLLYFAEKGYLSIEEYAEEKYKFVKQRDIPEGEEWQYAGDLFRRLFRDHEKVRTHKLSQSFREMVVVCTHTLKNEYDRKYGSPVKASSRAAQVFAIVVIGLLSFVGFLIGPAFTVPGVLLVYTGYENKRTIGKGSGMVIFGTILYIIGALLTGVSVGSIFTISPFGYAVFGLMLVMGFFAVIMPGRNEENTKLLGEILGFREFIETAEYERLKELSDENPQYFYHILPYATVLGMETKWANKFVNIPVVKPEWYITYHNRPFFYDERWTRNFMHDTITSSLPSPPASESSGGWSGGGGGGSSGGGGGGGGGGAW